MDKNGERTNVSDLRPLSSVMTEMTEEPCGKSVERGAEW